MSSTTIARLRYLTAYQVNPGNPRIVHHVLLFSLPDAEAELQAATKDAADAGLGGEGTQDEMCVNFFYVTGR